MELQPKLDVQCTELIQKQILANSIIFSDMTRNYLDAN